MPLRLPKSRAINSAVSNAPMMSTTAAMRGYTLACKQAIPNIAQPTYASRLAQILPVSANAVPKKANRKPISPRIPSSSERRKYSPTSPNNNTAPAICTMVVLTRTAEGSRPAINAKRLMKLTIINSTPATTAASPPQRIRVEKGIRLLLVCSKFFLNYVQDCTQYMLVQLFAFVLLERRVPKSSRL